MVRAISVTAALALLSAAPAMAAPGALDPAFGTGGTVLTSFPANPDAEVTSVGPAADGRLLAAGTVRAAGRNQFGIARYESDGDLDSGYGLAGLRLTDFGLTTNARALAMALQPDGSAVVAGAVSFSGEGSRLALARYLPDGSLDDGFGTEGVVITDVISTAEEARAVALQPDGRIVVAGLADSEVLVARYSSAGALDASFGTGGIVRTGIPGSVSAHAAGVAIQPDGRIVIGGTALVGTEEDRVLAVRYRADGVLDPSFGADGVAVPELGSGDERGNAIALGPDGRVTIAGATTFEDTGFLLTRFTADGGLDQTFGAGAGFMTRRVGRFGTDVARAVIVQPDGKAIAAGTTGVGGAAPDPVKWGILRVDRGGRLDETFGGDGVVTTEVVSGGLNEANAAALRSDGRLVVGGRAAAPGQPGDFAVARYQGDEADLSVDVSAAPNPVRPSRRLIYQLAVANAGPQTAEGVTVRIELPAPFVGVRPTQGSCAVAGDEVTCHLGSIAAGSEPVGIKLVVRPAEQGTLTVRAGVGSLTFDTVASNDTADQTVRAEGNADIRRPRITDADILTSTLARLLASGRLVVAVRSDERGEVEASVSVGRGVNAITIAEMEGAVRANRRRRLTGELTDEGRRFLRRRANAVLTVRLLARDATGNEGRRTFRERLR